MSFNFRFHSDPLISIFENRSWPELSAYALLVSVRRRYWRVVPDERVGWIFAAVDEEPDEEIVIADVYSDPLPDTSR